MSCWYLDTFKISRSAIVPDPMSAIWGLFLLLCQLWSYHSVCWTQFRDIDDFIHHQIIDDFCPKDVWIIQWHLVRVRERGWRYWSPENLTQNSMMLKMRRALLYNSSCKSSLSKIMKGHSPNILLHISHCSACFAFINSALPTLQWWVILLQVYLGIWGRYCSRSHN